MKVDAGSFGGRRPNGAATSSAELLREGALRSNVPVVALTVNYSPLL